MSHISDRETLLQALIQTSIPNEVRKVLEAIGDSPEIEPYEVFGSLGLQWRFFGERDSNMSTINLATDSGRSLVERITNAMDAVLEKEYEMHGSPDLKSAREAAKVFFGRPPSTSDSGIFSWKEYSEKGYDRLVHVTMTDSGNQTAPTLDIKDNGIGVSPGDFPQTILSLQKGNKNRKPYLIGAFGQGGAATFAFCEYTLIVSRRHDNPKEVGYTVVKLMRLDDSYDYDAWVYLAVGRSETTVTVPSVTIDESLALYDQELEINQAVGSLDSGTLVRHYGYRLDGYEGTLSPSPNNLYHLLHHRLFDPLLPFRIVDLRDRTSVKDELVTGSRNRLMRLTRGSGVEKGKTGSEVRHYARQEMISPLGDEDPSVAVEYWIVYNWRRYAKKIGLRSKSNDLFVDGDHPVLGTLNGQNQGEETARLVRVLNLNMVAKHVIVHIDATAASKEVRMGLFTSTREGFKNDIVKRETMDILAERMDEDEELRDIENELLEKLIESETTDTDQEVQKEITSLLKDAGYQVTEEGVVTKPGTGNVEIPDVIPKKKKKKAKLQPLHTEQYPVVTKLDIVYPSGLLQVRKGSHALLRIETDADYRFDREGRIAIRSDPAKIEVASTILLKGGRKYWRLRASEDSAVGDSGEVTVTITRPDGTQLSSSVDYEILKALESPSDESKGLVPAFKVIPIDPDEDPDRFYEIWDAKSEAMKVAYKPQKTAKGILVFYNTRYPPFREQLEVIKKKPGLTELFHRNYKIWIGYHAILQVQQADDVLEEEEIDPSAAESIREQQRAIVAEMQARQAIKTAALQQQSVVAKTE